MKKHIFNYFKFFCLFIVLLFGLVLITKPTKSYAQNQNTKEKAIKDTTNILILEKHKTTYRFDKAISYCTTDLNITFGDFIQNKATFLPYLVDGEKMILPPKQAAWFRIPVKSEYKEISEWFLQAGNGYQIKLYIPQLDNSYQEKRFGLLYKDSLQNSVPNYYSTTFSLRQGESVLYVRIVPSEHSVKQGGYQQTFVLFRKDAAHEFFSINLATNSIIYTIILAMFVYNLILFFLIKDRSYLYYCIAIFFIGVYFYTLPTLKSVAFWGQLSYDSELNYIVNYTSAFLTVIFWIKFTQSYFTMRENFPKWNRYFLGIIILNVIVGVFYIIFVEQIANIYATTLHLITIISLLSFSAIVFFRKKLLAKQFFVANLALFIFVIIYLAYIRRLIPSNSFTNSALEIGVVAQVILFSLALASRINLLRKQVTQQSIDKEKLERVKAEEIKYVIEEKNKELEGEVQERTLEISEKNTELEQIIEELDTTNETLRYTINRVEEQNTQITSSIAYAQRIQQATLPSLDQIRKSFSENFIVFRPLHVVSGDFYWFLELEKKRFLGAFDCTGHGVPGAFMALVANGLLNEIVVHKKIISPDKILEELHKSIQYSLKQNQTKDQDSIDGSLMCIEKIEDENQNYTVQIASARNSVYLFDSEGCKGIKEIKGDRKSIGGSTHQEEVFSLHALEIKEQTDFYMLSDGLQDQFGEVKNKKFMKKRVRELLTEITAYDSSLQKRTIESTIDNWKGNKEQTDDILIMGLRLG
ncbi:7TM-containing protein possibly involved in signal transduction [Bernardetia litoralis DSM 6794]|uniref:7TM-containing protein possibly involved in signal transduction n=1 Tax=Bernardetia litoralis (strain ATCC 23117 / DSM 6794 / NBRC 15988 / NCIMB 1366 / Fx l1 / Sio-4) TaxID=880071 RepID=I4AMM3_BERLS|nr:7TM diverse intracellular signaling domain-containing protein [Bernardetia litoralis]AFM05208.1 7TM-containing protein possibly involved in signal transduction [Bernardetia litoralis DSM 6794]